MKLLLIDGNSVLFRGFYATCYGNMMKTSFGVYTNAIYAFSNMLEKALKLIKPEYCLVAFDKGKATFRHQFDSEYKGGRKKAPDELVMQFPLVREMLEAYNIKYLEYDEIEADDIIGSMAKKYNFETCIFSSDHDLLQLIDDSTSVYVMKKGMSDIVKMDEKALMSEYSLKPYQIIDYKGLAGDNSDNIKGVEGIGDKTAVKLLNDYDTCEGIYEHIDDLKGKLKEKLIEGKDSCFKSKFLATIKTDYNIEYDLDYFKLDINNRTRNEFFKKYEMFSLINEEIKDVKVQDNYLDYEVTNISEALYNNPFISFISNEFTYYHKKVDGVCFSTLDKCEYISFENLINDQKTIAFLASGQRKIVFDLKALMHFLDEHNIEINNADDLYLMAFLANNYNSDLETILLNYGLNLELSLKDIYGSEKRPLDIDKNKLIDYAVTKSQLLRKLYDVISKELEEKDITKLYREVELPLAKVLFKMEKEGITCDETILDKISLETFNKLNELEKDIYSYAGEEFNINSPKQLQDILYNKLELPNIKKGGTGAEVLVKLVNYHPIIQKVLDYRKYSKLYSSYSEGLKRFIENGLIHTIYSQTIVQTGRLSSYDPNLQNISVRDEESKEIRKAFVPRAGHVLISSDYSQIELRVLASLANETKMIDAFNSGIDIHTKTAMDIFKLSKDEVTDSIRRKAKAVNFGVVYGISDFGLANQTSISVSEAKEFINDYFDTYPSIKRYLDEQIDFCKENGYVKTILNRRRYIKEISDRNFMVREFGKRAAMNSTIQGSAADIIKLAMIKVDNKISELNLKSKLLLQVHDELIFDVPNDEIEIMKKTILESMHDAYDLKADLDSSLAVGYDWLEAK